MPSDEHWTATRITEARKHHLLVTEAVSARIAPLLDGEFSQRLLTPTQLAAHAKALIADMVPAPPKVEAKQ